MPALAIGIGQSKFVIAQQALIYDPKARCRYKLPSNTPSKEAVQDSSHEVARRSAHLHPDAGPALRTDDRMRSHRYVTPLWACINLARSPRIDHSFHRRSIAIRPPFQQTHAWPPRPSHRVKRREHASQSTSDVRTDPPPWQTDRPRTYPSVAWPLSPRHSRPA
jgi:hypothetical protein